MNMREYIKSDAVNKNLNIGSQTKHIRGSHNFDPGRSEVYGTIEDMQRLVDVYHGTGEVRGHSLREGAPLMEFIVLDSPIGIYREITTGEEYETNTFTIRYGKKGAHIVPARRVIR
ncbi:MAG: hypothetical protein LBE35_06600 [Clostridiales bacterium]|jgi:hypothetical protein|nr:hypothetical protein [Clostridiales bacterium]